MFDIVEKYRPVFTGLLVVIAASFVTFGVQSFGDSGRDYLIKIGNEEITDNDVRRAIQSSERLQQPLTANRAYQSLEQQAYLIEGAKKLNVAVSEHQVKQLIMNDPTFWEDGKFSQTLFNQYLQSAQMNEAQFVESLKRQFYLQTMYNIITAGEIVSSAQAKILLDVFRSEREVASYSFQLAQFTDKVAVTDKALEAYYQSHLSDYKEPLAIKYAYVLVSPEDLATKQEVTDEEIAAYISKENIESANSHAAALDPAEVKRLLQLDKARRAFALLKEEMAEQSLNSPEHLNDVAKASTVGIKEFKEWMTLDAAKAQGLSEPVIEALFSDDVLKEGNNSDVIEVANAAWVVRVMDVREERTLPLAEIKDRVTRDFVLKESKELAIKEAQSVFKALEEGKNPSLQWSPNEKVDLQMAQGILAPSDFQKFVRAQPQKDKAAYVLLDQLPTPVLMRIDSIKVPESSAELLASAKQGLMQRESDSTFMQYLKYLEKELDVTPGMQKLTDE